MKIISKISLVLATAALMVGCESTELDLLDNPNNLNPSSADANFLLNDVQLRFNSVMNSMNNASTGVIRHRNQFGTYNGAVDDLTLTAAWENAYRLFGSVDVIEGLAAADETGLPYHSGIAHILEAYTYVTLVDYLGDVPFSQANNPEEFPTPSVDSGKDIYTAMFAQLDAAINELETTTGPDPLNDLYYGANYDNWIALANTLKIKMYNQVRLDDPVLAKNGINAVLADGRIIDTIDEDFQFQYSTEQNLAEGRHPFFTGNYLAAGAGTYMSNNLYDLMNVGDNQPPFIETGNTDPRARYYFYRQSSSAPSGSNLPCAGNPSYNYCYVGNLYWGRDHGDDEGIPNDGTKRTTYGVYPAGGAFDADQFQQARDPGLAKMDGAGIAPNLIASYTHFILAEGALTVGSNGNALTLLQDAIRLSMNKVRNFTTLDNGTPFEMTQGDIDAYVANVTAEYGAANPAGKLNVIIREYFIAAYGNGREAYINYKRTGYPNLEAPIIAAGPFPRSYRYPSDELVTNPNIQQNNPTDKVFWDKNPDGFID